MQKISTGTVTFHASHNYGSMLQAYALQRILFSIGVDNEIINLRTGRQKEMYAKPNLVDFSSLKRIVKTLILLPYNIKLIRKYDLFEEFLTKHLFLSKEFSSYDQIAKSLANKYDYLIAGSDQIWNTSCWDFDWAYYLPFSTNNAISYAPSMGPHAKEKITEDKYDTIRSYLANFSAISVREKGTADLINYICGSEPDILVDPTMLLSKEEWESKIQLTPLVKNKYLFIYTPWLSSEILKVGKELGKLLKLKVVISNFSFCHFFDSLGMKKVLACGPWEFLNLIRYSSLVLSGSFHAVIFSIIFQRPFFALDGDKDNRIAYILSKMNLDNRIIHSNDIAEVAFYAFNIDFSHSINELNKERCRSIKFLKTHLNIF